MAIVPEILDSHMAKTPDNRERLLDTWLGLTGQAPLPAGPVVLPVLSGSMQPFIALGSRILIEPCDAASCQVGDVAIFHEGERLIAHRILWFFGGRKNCWVFHKGDANRFGHWIRPSRIKGVVKDVMPPGDQAGSFPGMNPYSVEAARTSRQDYLRNLILAVPRLLRGLATKRSAQYREAE